MSARTADSALRARRPRAVGHYYFTTGNPKSVDTFHTSNKHYIGLETKNQVTNFMWFVPRRHHVLLQFKIPRDPEVDTLLEDSPLPILPYQAHWGQCRLQISQGDIQKNRELLQKLIAMAKANYGGGTAD